MTPARVPPMPLAQARAVLVALPETSCWTAMRAGTPLPSTYWARTTWPGPLGATMAMSTFLRGLISL